MKNLKRKNGLYYFKETRLYVPAEELKKNCFTSFTTCLWRNISSSRYNGRTLKRYFWPCMGADVEEYIKTCVKCQMTKYSTQSKIKKLRPLPIPK